MASHRLGPRLQLEADHLPAHTWGGTSIEPELFRMRSDNLRKELALLLRCPTDLVLRGLLHREVIFLTPTRLRIRPSDTFMQFDPLGGDLLLQGREELLLLLPLPDIPVALLHGVDSFQRLSTVASSPKVVDQGYRRCRLLCRKQDDRQPFAPKRFDLMGNLRAVVLVPPPLLPEAVTGCQP